MKHFENSNILTNYNSRADFENEFYKKNPAGTTAILKHKTVAIAGAGGLGSNIAVMLIRSGVYDLIIADYDTIELSNLNRQHFFFNQLGMLKVEALKENLLKINPYVNITTAAERITRENAAKIFAGSDILIEAFDRAEMKAMIIETWHQAFKDKFIIAASGIAGADCASLIKIESYGKLIICGDQSSDAAKSGLLSPRVTLTAALQACCALEILLTGDIKIDRNKRP